VEELERIAAVAAGLVADGELLSAVLPTEARPGARLYVCAFENHGERTWLALDAAGAPVADRQAVRDAVSIAALCEIAGETAAGGDLDELRSQLAALRVTDAPPGIEEVEESALELQCTIGAPPQLATPSRLDAIGAAARRLELALDPAAGSPFAAAMRSAAGAVDELVREVEGGYRGELR
jgi:hypothetical protein